MRTDELAGLTAGQLMDVMKILMAVLALPRSAADHVDAIVVPTGQGEQWRLTHAIRAWETNRDIRYLLVANGNPAEETYVDITPEYLRGLGLRRISGVHIQAGPAPNTGLQAAWIADQVEDLGITSFALTVSSYHLPRVYLTVLKALSRSGTRIPIIPVPVAISPSACVEETKATSYDLLPGEVARILTYMDGGWVATFEELQDYLQWLWTHHESLLVRVP